MASYDRCWVYSFPENTWHACCLSMTYKHRQVHHGLLWSTTGYIEQWNKRPTGLWEKKNTHVDFMLFLAPFVCEVNTTTRGPLRSSCVTPVTTPHTFSNLHLSAYMIIWNWKGWHLAVLVLRTYCRTCIHGRMLWVPHLFQLLDNRKYVYEGASLHNHELPR